MVLCQSYYSIIYHIIRTWVSPASCRITAMSKKLATNPNKNIFHYSNEDYSVCFRADTVMQGVLKCLLSFPSTLKACHHVPALRRRKTPSQLWFLMWHLIQPLKGTVGCPSTAVTLPPPRPAPPQAKPRWVHVKDHMTIGIPDPARDWEWIRPNSTMSQAAKGIALETEPAFSTWTHTDRTTFLWKCHIVCYLQYV